MDTLFIGQNLITLTQVDSTNNYANEMLKNMKPPEGTVIMALSQTNGKGQHDRKWESESGKNLILSYILYPTFLNPAESFNLSIISALAVSDFIKKETTAPVNIKWPNDVYINGTKACGMLIENGFRGPSLSYSVIGVGININQESFEAGFDATSLKIITGKEFNLKACVESLSSKLEGRYLQLKNKGIESLKKEYVSLLYRKDLSEKYSYNDATFDGTIRGVTDTGELLIERKGTIESYTNNSSLRYIK